MPWPGSSANGVDAASRHPALLYHHTEFAHTSENRRAGRDPWTAGEPHPSTIGKPTRTPYVVIDVENKQCLSR
jgi:hypothetical protein